MANKVRFIVLGAGGHLASTKVLPAIASWQQHHPEKELEVWKVARSITPSDFAISLQQYSDPSPLANALGRAAADKTVYFFALPPSQILVAATGLFEAGLLNDPGAVLAIEKPFGIGSVSSRELHSSLLELVSEDQLYLIDHYLGKDTVQNILAFRFANGAFSNLWCGDCIDHIQITIAESATVSGRAGFYDATGALHDVLQNHMLQLVAYLAMDLPEAFTREALAAKKMEVLSNLTLDPRQTVYGQYEGYLAEQGVAIGSVTETFVSTVATISTANWSGVPFVLRTGKAMHRRVAEISIVFKQTALALFPDQPKQVLTFRIQPDEGIGFTFSVKKPRSTSEITPAEMSFCYAEELPDAYEHIVDDILSGDTRFALQHDLIGRSWEIVEELQASLGKKVLEKYPVGSWGPESADTIVTSLGTEWLVHQSTLCNGVQLLSSE